VTVETSPAVFVSVTPFAIADLGDRDNNQELCIDVPGVPVAVEVEPGTVSDPRGELNPATAIVLEG
jgi:hypothetical protein